jgi:hypothetical protein
MAIGLLAGMICPNIGQGSIVTGLGSGKIGGFDVSAKVEFSINSSGDLEIALYNTGKDANYGLAQVLTGVSFNMEDVDFVIGSGTRSKVVVGPESTLSCYDKLKKKYTPYAAGTNVSKEWGVARDIDLLDVDHKVIDNFDLTAAATTPVEGIIAFQFATGDFSPGGNLTPGLDKEDFGLINAESRMNTNLKTTSLITNSVVITLQPLSGPLTARQLSLISNAAFEYGSRSSMVGIPDAIVPEPVSLAIWSLLGLCWVGRSIWQQRHGLYNRGPSWNRRRGARCDTATRPPWPEHVRVAIREIIDRGCPR